MTLAQWLDVWTADYMSDKKYLTVKHYKAQVEAHITPERMKDESAARMEAYIKAL